MKNETAKLSEDKLTDLKETLEQLEEYVNDEVHDNVPYHIYSNLMDLVSSINIQVEDLDEEA